MRDIIKLENAFFKESDHKYYLDNIAYPSVSGFLKIVEPYKDWNKIAENYANKHNLKKEDVQAMWEANKLEKAGRGSVYHLYKETNEVNAIQNFVINDIKPIFDLRTLPDGLYTELIVYNNEYGIFGTIDRCIIETIDNIRYVDIKDYKTNDDLDFESYYNPRTKKYSMLEQPCSHLMDTKYSKYSLQLSTYAYFMERYGYIIRSLEINHHKLKEADFGEPGLIIYENKDYVLEFEKDYEVKYLKNEVINMLKKWKLNQKYKKENNDN